MHYAFVPKILSYLSAFLFFVQLELSYSFLNINEISVSFKFQVISPTEVTIECSLNCMLINKLFNIIEWPVYKMTLMFSTMCFRG